MKLFSPVFVIFLAVAAHGDTLPGFRVERVATLPGFASSLAIDSRGTVYATTTSGWIYRIDDGNAVEVTSLPTKAGGNGGLLGMALIDDRTAAVHYTHWLDEHRVLDDVVSRVDLVTGAETPLHRFACDIEVPERGGSDEHHGGNPAIGPDGSIFVGIGEYMGFEIAQKPQWNGGKIFRIDRDGAVTQFALGMRNPYDLAWDPELGKVVVADNGPKGGDELHIIGEGSNCGWPLTSGNERPVDGAVVPDYVFPSTVAPTGLLRLTKNANAMLRGGYLVGGFVTKTIYYFPDLAAAPVAPPIALVSDFKEYVMDVAQEPNGELYFITATFAGTSTVHRLRVPPRGDCNGDALADWRDVLALLEELDDAESQPMLAAHEGAYPGAWGCDVNADSLINAADLDALTRLLIRRRAIRTR